MFAIIISFAKMQAECALKLPGPRCSPSSSCWGHSVWSPTSRKSCWHPDGAGWGMGSPWSPQFWGWERGPCTVSGQRWLQTSCGLRALRSSPTADPALAHQGESRWRKHGLCLVPVSRGTRGCRILSTLALAVSPRCQLTSPNTGLEIPLLGRARAPASPARRSFLRAVAVPDLTAELGCCDSRGDSVPVDVGHLPRAPRVLVAREAQPGRTWQAMKGDGFLPQPASRHVAKPLPLVRCHPGLSHLCAGHASEG